MRISAKIFLSLSILWLWTVVPAAAQDVSPTEYQLKAAFLFNFAKFVDWPSAAFTNSAAPLVIGVLGQDPFGKDLENTVRNKNISGRSIVARTVGSIPDARQCHILFISNSESKRLREILEGLRGASVLTVGENEKFFVSGGMVNFVVEGRKIRFQINDAAAKAAGLKISSKLLSLALPAPR
ncbi:MAG TPA: YfiR family protein [Verrucomicrobiae bacterium]|jgi:hypothetical protein|nr:YfiR family protein [Verrucomicrobiae bacterium]